MAVVIPVIYRPYGVRESLLLAKSLADEGAKVEVLIHTADSDAFTDIKNHLGNLAVFCLNSKKHLRPSRAKYLFHQLTRRLDRELANVLKERHAIDRYDAIIVCANEGHWISEYVLKWRTDSRPVLGVYVQELIDHVILLRRERSFGIMRSFLSALLPLLHFIEQKRLSLFDVMLPNSKWTSQILRYLYGFETDMIISILDLKTFARPADAVRKDYIALPTSSLDENAKSIAVRLFSEGIKLISYGPECVNPVPYVGFLSDSEMIKFLSEAKATLFLFDYEGLGLIPLESLAVGTPVITYDKQGPLSALEAAPNDCVLFGHTYEDLRNYCNQFIHNESPPCKECIDFMTVFSPERYAKQLICILRECEERQDGN